ncbi:MAG TPA: TonB family protein [Pyrinomonadaceae bacterium]|nr:TonB family protein [Pyrinomonadaceae bacterium]
MFDKLVESGSQRDDMARKGSFFLGTLLLYTVVLVGAFVVSVYWYNSSIPDPSLELLTLVAPVPMQAEEPPPPRDEPKPAARQEPTVAMRQEISVIAPVTKSQEVAKETTKEVARNKSLGVVVGDRDIGSSADITSTTGQGVVAGTPGAGAGGPSGPVVATDPPPPPPAPKPTPTPEPPKRTAPISGGVLNGKAISKPQPPYPPIAKAARASGTVTVQITVDESGRVISASAVSGHPLLRAAAEGAARQARFSPTLLSGQPVKVTGVITYNFVLQ